MKAFFLFGRLMGKVAVMTGAARGIGAATARIFAESGASVVIADILDEQGISLADSIGGRYIHCDVTKESDVEAAIQLAIAWKGKLDIMFNNAGIGGLGGSITGLEMEHVKHVLSINVIGIVHGLKHAAKAMVEGKRGGSIICTSSSAAIMGGLGGHAYTLSKEAILGVMRSSACELGKHGIRVNCISPHGVPTVMLVDAYKEVLRKVDLTPAEVGKVVGDVGSLLRGRCGTPEDTALAALFLASDESGFITGHNLVIDGGYTSATTSMRIIYE